MVRRAAAAALSRLGLAALPALDALNAAVEDLANEEIVTYLRRTQKHLYGYVWGSEQLTKYRYALMNDAHPTSRSAAVFSMRFVAELALPAIPGLEVARVDPRNRDFAGQIQKLLDYLRRYEDWPYAQSSASSRRVQRHSHCRSLDDRLERPKSGRALLAAAGQDAQRELTTDGFILDPDNGKTYRRGLYFSETTNGLKCAAMRSVLAHKSDTRPLFLNQESHY